MSSNSLPPDDVPALAESGNPYAAHYQQHQQRAAQPDLDAAAPALGNDALRRLNRRALVFFSGIMLLVVIAGLWIFTVLLNRNNGATAKKPREEVIAIPAAPKPQLTPPAAPIPAPALVPAPAPIPAPLPVPAYPMEPIGLAPAAPPPASSRYAPTPPKQKTLLERRIADSATVASIVNGIAAANQPSLPGQQPFAGAFGPGADTTDPGVPFNRAYAGKPLSPTSSARPLVRPDTLMLRGTYIRCVLETHIVTDIPGFTSCIVTEPVYSFSGKRLLLPKGSKVLGKYDTEPNGPRVSVIWDRIVTPTGIDVNMASPGIDNLGGAGHVGDLDEHWASRIGSAMLISLFSDAFKYAAAQYGPGTSTVTGSGSVVQSPFESNTAQTLQNFANQAVRRAANRPATVTIHQGAVVNVYVARDVDFSAVVSRY